MADNYTTVDQLPNNAEIADSDIIYEKSQTDNLGNGTDYKVTASALKAYVRPELAGENNSGLMGTAAQTFSGKKTFKNDVDVDENLKVGKNAEVMENLHVDGNFEVDGDFILHGSQTQIDVKTIEVSDNFVTVRDNAATSLGSNEMAGVRIYQPHAAGFTIGVTGDGVPRVGRGGATSRLAEMAESPANGTLAVFNTTSKKYEPIPQGPKGALLESQGNGIAPAFVTHPKVSIDHITQTVESTADGGVNVIECELTNGNKTEFRVRNGKGAGGGGGVKVYETENDFENDNTVKDGDIIDFIGYGFIRKNADGSISSNLFQTFEYEGEEVTRIRFPADKYKKISFFEVNELFEFNSEELSLDQETLELSMDTINEYFANGWTSLYAVLENYFDYATDPEAPNNDSTTYEFIFTKDSDSGDIILNFTITADTSHEALTIYFI